MYNLFAKAHQAPQVPIYNVQFVKKNKTVR